MPYISSLRECRMSFTTSVSINICIAINEGLSCHWRHRPLRPGASPFPAFLDIVSRRLIWPHGIPSPKVSTYTEQNKHPWTEWRKPRSTFGLPYYVGVPHRYWRHSRWEERKKLPLFILVLSLSLGDDGPDSIKCSGLILIRVT